ncbi:aminotransferase class V-fold PLP-dependent enzyme [Micromonospora maritima]|uniref:aminotransferase class V-fold PLP-dependent enzyme n=1 Tax=Micromonospora maritima TaxID=986711 RepID=UPI00157D2F53|nr:aminotransferase class V-fold PLP-dependent enzyme [Micromonospora maritima]
MSPDTDDEQVTRWAHRAGRGDQQAAAAFVRALQGPVWRFLAHLAGPAEADDLAQETFLRALRSLPGFAGRSSARTWVFTIARRVAVDHVRAATVRPRVAALSDWQAAAEAAGATVRWAEFDPDTAELPAGQYADLVTDRTRLVAVTAGSNATGTAPDVAAIAKTAHAAGALVCVDGVHSVPHGPTDLASVGADFLVTSAYKWSGPHLAAMVADPARWESLHPAKLIPSADAVPDRFEYGTPSFPLLAGVTAAVDHLASLDPTAGGDRRERVRAGLAAAQAHEEAVFDRLLAGLAARSFVTVYGAPARRCPTVSFRVAGQAPARTAAALGEAGICLSSGDYYAYEYFRTMGLRDSGGAVRASVYHYNTVDEVDRLLAELDRLADSEGTMVR